jgi:hypothetical protein
VGREPGRRAEISGPGPARGQGQAGPGRAFSGRAWYPMARSRGAECVGLVGVLIIKKIHFLYFYFYIICSYFIYFCVISTRFKPSLRRLLGY